MKRWWVFFIALALQSSTGYAETMQLIVKGLTDEGNQFTGKGTCFVVGQVDGGGVLLVTAKHNLRDARQASVIKGGVGYQIRNIREHETEDVASFESDVPYGGEYELRQPVERIRVEVYGFGPHYHGRKSCGFTGEVVSTTFMEGDGGLHSCLGDSGGPVVWQKQYVVGLVSGVSEISEPPSVRSQFSSQRPKTVLVDAQTISTHLTQYYSRQCGPNGCSVYLRPQIQQPHFMGIPTGPPRVVGVTPPIDSIGFVTTPGQSYEPQKISTPPVPSASAVNVSVGQQDVRKALEDLIRERPEIFRGPAGPRGPIAQQEPLRVILARNGVKIDEEIIQPGQPLILDVGKMGGSK